MLLGHYAPALLLKARRPAVPLWVLFVAVELLDLLWSAFVLAGLEHVRIVPGINASNALDPYDMPLSHSLAATAVWSALAGVAAIEAQRGKPGRFAVAAVIALAVASHFALDLVVHVRDLPLTGADSPRLGFGLWNWRALAGIVEAALLVGSALVLTFALGWQRWRAWRRLAGAMAALCVGSFFVPTPPGPAAMALTGLALYTGLAVAAWRLERGARPGGMADPSA